MTEDERQAIESTIIESREELDKFQANFLAGIALADLYDLAKPVHTSALGIWSTVVDILRARKGFDKREPETDAINLDELFDEKENVCGN